MFVVKVIVELLAFIVKFVVVAKLHAVELPVNVITLEFKLRVLV